MKFEPFKSPSNNHQGFGQGDGAEHTTVKEFVDGVNKYFKAIFSGSLGAPAVDPAVEDAATVLAQGLDDAHKRISDLEEGLAEMQRRFDTPMAPVSGPTGTGEAAAPLDTPADANTSEGVSVGNNDPVPEPISVKVE